MPKIIVGLAGEAARIAGGNAKVIVEFPRVPNLGETFRIEMPQVLEVIAKEAISFLTSRPLVVTWAGSLTHNNVGYPAIGVAELKKFR